MTSHETIGDERSADRQAQEIFNSAILDNSATLDSVAALLTMPELQEVAAPFEDVLTGFKPRQEETKETVFQTHPYEFSDEDFDRLRDFLARKRLEEAQEKGKLPSSISASFEKPRFTIKRPGDDWGPIFEFYAVSYAKGKVIMLAHPEQNSGWGCAVALGYEEKKGEMEVNRIDFSGYTDVVWSSLDLMDKYKIET